MAVFKLAYQRTGRTEGGYANNPSDRGGETWKGVARKMWPEWSGWRIVDEIKKQYPDLARFKTALAQSASLELKVQDFYKAKFWTPMRGDEIKDQILAEQIYDGCVNFGSTKGIKLYQKSLGMTETGIVDNKMLNRINHTA